MHESDFVWTSCNISVAQEVTKGTPVECEQWIMFDHGQTRLIMLFAVTLTLVYNDNDQQWFDFESDYVKNTCFLDHEALSLLNIYHIS